MSQTSLKPQFYDPSSFSNPDVWLAKNTRLRLDVDFDKKIIKGTCEIYFRRQLGGHNDEGDVISEANRATLKHIILDTSDLSINKVYAVNGEDDSLTELRFGFSKSAVGFGKALLITLDTIKPMSLVLIIEYETGSEASGLNWMPEEQTAGGKHPYLYTQCQPIHARSIFPCQDTPYVKMSFNVEITVPSPLKAVVVGLSKERFSTSSNEKNTFHYHMDNPIPAYLMAFAVGLIESRKIGPRSSVWSEKELVDAAAEEFSQTEDMLTAAESLFGPYVWKKYDILVLPPSFPFGGMENPCITFVTPSLLAGDKSLANVIAHEIAHSWTGNLVTNENWEHFWLNEGLTVFAERKIIGKLKGEPFRQFGAILGLKDLKDAVKRYGEKSPLTALCPSLEHVHPDDAFSSVPYEKGFTFLYYLEELVGGAEKFEPFFRLWIEKNAFKTVNSSMFQDFFTQHFGATIADKVDWDKWFHATGMPVYIPKYDASLALACVNLAQKFVKSDEVNSDLFPAKEFLSLSSEQKMEFLGQLLQLPSGSFDAKKLVKLNEIYKISEINNAEVQFRWLRLAIAWRIDSVLDNALKFVNSYGRMKFTRPIYRDLFAWKEVREKTVENFLLQRKKMAYVAANQIAKDLHVGE